ncbi:MAG: response regulator [Oculatellaceae cyanobacterium Prado106]|jgi:DNA-binding response OmpR family regulator/HPt (histidine-containing phosphotransfer) domain-containing protein|nr:response regulator [Oculatellaceae cyanobacterium Prado106]
MTKLLVVDSDRNWAQAIQKVLLSQSFSIDLATDAQSGWTMRELTTYDLIVLGMTRGDRLQWVRNIRKQGDRTPIFALADPHEPDPMGEVEQNPHQTDLDLGIEDTLFKPTSLSALSPQTAYGKAFLTRIQTLLQNRRLALLPILQWGALVLDPNLCQVTYAGHSLSLRNKEYRLLELFLKNQHRIFTQQTLMDTLWNFDEQPTENAVRAHIKSLRKRLKQAGAGDLIETIYGLGYRLKKAESSTPHPPESSSPHIPPEFAQAWERHGSQYGDRIRLIERLIQAFHSGIASVALHQQATREAHTLVGSLGTFGLEKAALQARKIEQLLSKIRVSEMPSPLRLAQLAESLRDLQRTVQQVSVQPTPANQATLLADGIQSVRSPIPSTPTPAPRACALTCRLAAHLLIVEDDPIWAEELVEAGQMYGVKSAIATNLTQARAALYKDPLEQPPDLILLDLSLSDANEDGFQLLEELNAQHSPIPVIVVTAHQDLAERVRVARLGGQGFVSKPVQPAQVMTLVRQRLEQFTPADSRLLIIDDDTAILDLLRTGLQPQGFSITLLSEPDDFWSTLEQTQPDLVLLNIEMPHWNGLDLCQVIRNDIRWQNLPVMFISAHRDTSTLHRSFMAGADDYLVKPIAIPELIDRILHRLRRSHRDCLGVSP